MKHLFSVFIFAVFSNLLWAGQMKLLAPQNSYPTDTRSDSIDIINTEINLKIIDQFNYLLSWCTGS